MGNHKSETKVKKVIYILIFIIMLLLVFLYTQNNWLYINNIDIKEHKLELNKDYKIVHLSDLHNKMFGKNQKRLVNKIEKLKPDIIVYTGDIVDSYDYNEEPAFILMEEITKIAPVYYVSGNHEIRIGNYDYLKKELIKRDVNVLDDEVVKLKIEENTVDLIGLKDDMTYNLPINLKSILENNSSNNYKILLCHKPEIYKFYDNNNVDLVFTGHAHGGQIRIPFVGGIIAPEQGLFPKYTEGAHKFKDTTLVISRGLGNSAFPFRIFNRPEIVLVNLKA